MYGIFVIPENRVLRKIHGHMREKVADGCRKYNVELGEFFILAKCYNGHQINEDEMEVGYGIFGKVENLHACGGAAG